MTTSESLHTRPIVILARRGITFCHIVVEVSLTEKDLKILNLQNGLA